MNQRPRVRANELVLLAITLILMSVLLAAARFMVLPPSSGGSLPTPATIARQS